MDEQFKNPSSGFGFKEIIVLAFLIGFFGFVLKPNFIPNGSHSPANTCINNMRQMDAAINEWAVVNGKTNGVAVTGNDIKPYIKLGSDGHLPKCPMGGKYTFRKVGDVPQVTCSLSTLTPGHFLP
jgi:hypothetical protein